MVKRKRAPNKTCSGAGESQAGPFQFDYTENNKISKLWNSLKEDSGNHTLFAIIAVSIAVATTVHFITPSVTNQNSNNITINTTKNSTTNKNITINQRISNVKIELRQWKDIPLEERRIIKEEARVLFPDEISGIKRDWNDFANWLAEKHNAVSPSPRDLFR